MWQSCVELKVIPSSSPRSKCHIAELPFLVSLSSGVSAPVWTPDPSGCVRKGLGNNLARKCLAGMPRFLNPANFIFRSSMQLVRYYSNFQNFYVLPNIHFLSSVELERWLAKMRSFPHLHRRQHSSAQDTSGQGYSPDPSSRGQKGLGSRLSQLRVHGYFSIVK